MATPTLTIRPATTPADLALVRTLMREYGAYLADRPGGAASICLTGYDQELAALPEPYLAPGGLLLALRSTDALATKSSEAVGCIALKPLDPPPRAADAPARSGSLAIELKRLWVRPAARGLHVGRELMQAAIEHARAAHAISIYLDTVPAAMPEANRLYAALGFERVERYNDNPVHDVAFFHLPLDRPTVAVNLGRYGIREVTPISH